MKEKLLSRIAERKITVGVVGLGYVGLPLAVERKPRQVSGLSASTCRKKKK